MKLLLQQIYGFLLTQQLQIELSPVSERRMAILMSSERKHRSIRSL